eukprot:TRINITY_DN11608_c0_g1_i1.p1 TRINITY_DN11608_c0_g1~~TRINITY_DN11608_c0_g1_i1.p1  ORF type:complete len:418 (-),score=154.49 TRINITY_DN11608_c0_g1_i1:180-1433(-)
MSVPPAQPPKPNPYGDVQHEAAPYSAKQQARKPFTPPTEQRRGRMSFNAELPVAPAQMADLDVILEESYDRYMKLKKQEIDASKYDRLSTDEAKIIAFTQERKRAALQRQSRKPLSCYVAFRKCVRNKTFHDEKEMQSWLTTCECRRRACEDTETDVKRELPAMRDSFDSKRNTNELSQTSLRAHAVVDNILSIIPIKLLARVFPSLAAKRMKEEKEKEMQKELEFMRQQESMPIRLRTQPQFMKEYEKLSFAAQISVMEKQEKEEKKAAEAAAKAAANPPSPLSSLLSKLPFKVPQVNNEQINKYLLPLKQALHQTQATLVSLNQQARPYIQRVGQYIPSFSMEFNKKYMNVPSTSTSTPTTPTLDSLLIKSPFSISSSSSSSPSSSSSTPLSPSVSSSSSLPLNAPVAHAETKKN